MFRTVTIRALTLTAAIASLTLPSFGMQDEVPQQESVTESRMVIAASSDEGGQVEMSAIQFSSEDGVGDVFTFVAPVGGQLALPMMGGEMSDMSQFLINDPAIQSEIELMDDQRSQIDQLNNEFGREMKDAIESTMKGPDADHGRIGEIIADIRKRQTDRLGQILLPHQVDRLKQISFQRNEQARGMEGVLASSKLAEELGIDEEQQQRIKDRAAELKQEYEAKVAELKASMRKQLLEELTPEQREKVEQMRGSDYEFKQPEIRSRTGAPRRGRIRQ